MGNLIGIPLIKGDWKKQPNYPTKQGVIFAYCPPEQVAAEMDRLVAMHQDHLDVASIMDGLMKAADRSRESRAQELRRVFTHAEFRDLDEDEQTHSTIMSVTDEAFVFFYNETPEQTKHRFTNWREKVVAIALKQLLESL